MLVGEQTELDVISCAVRRLGNKVHSFVVSLEIDLAFSVCYNVMMMMMVMREDKVYLYSIAEGLFMTALSKNGSNYYAASHTVRATPVDISFSKITQPIIRSHPHSASNKTKTRQSFRNDFSLSR